MKPYNYYEEKKTFKNPIISGFYPDPSICRVGEDYYLVNSSFEFFPSIPVWHSKDLVNWTQITNAIDRKEQGLKLDVNVSGGVQACTIREHNGTFYITSTCVGKTWPSLEYNFIITAKNPAGPWSEVHYLEDAPGIDSSLFFDDDGKAYFHANRQKLSTDVLSDAEIWIQEIDLEKFELIGEKHILWDGYGGIYPEGPHIYKKDGYYYLLIAEGGTLHFHTVTMARSKNLFGPYEASPRNPILSHKHLHRTYPIHNVGHADIVETQNGEWYMVCLGSRPRGGYYGDENLTFSFGGYYRNLGRETFLAPMVWEDEFGPIVSPLTGKIEEEYPFPDLQPSFAHSKSVCSHFDDEKLELFWCAIRNMDKDFYSLSERKGYLRLKMKEQNITEDGDVSFLGRRQTAWNFFAGTKVEFNLNEKEEFGLTSYITYASHLRLSVKKEDGKLKLSAISRFQKEDTIIETIEIAETDKIWLKVEGREQEYRFFYKTKAKEWTNIGGVIDGRVISADLNDVHTGSFVGIYTSSNKEKTGNHVDFDYFEYSDF